MQTTRNILKVYRSATDKQREDGMRWYRDAHQLAYIIGNRDVWFGAAMLAAYSPLTKWDKNIEYAINTVYTGEPVWKCGRAANNAKVADMLLNGVEPKVAVKGPKTSVFMDNIANAGVGDSVTIDNHAYNIAYNTHIPSSKMPRIGKAEREMLMQSYRNAAKIEKVSPTEMQAITWVAWRG